MSLAEFRELATTVCDEILAGLTLAFAQELQRRIAKNHRHERNGRKSLLDRAIEQLIAILNEQDTKGDFE